MIYNGFSLFHFRYFYPLDIIWTLFSEKQAFFALFQAVLQTKSGHYSEQFSLPGNVLVFLNIYVIRNACARQIGICQLHYIIHIKQKATVLMLLLYKY